MRLKTLGLAFAGILLTTALFGLIASAALNQVLRDSQQVRGLLKQSGVYSAVIPQQLTAAQRDNPALEGLPLNDPAIQALLAKSFDQRTVEQSGDKIIGGIYDWLEGRTPEPEFNVTVEPDTAAIAEMAGTVARQRAAALPACGPGQAPLAPGAPVSEATCLPPGLPAETVESVLAKQLRENAGLIPAINLTADQVQLEPGRPLADTLTPLKRVYQFVQPLPLVFGIAAGVLAAVISALGGLGRGLRVVGISLVVAALASMAGAWFADTLHQHAYHTFSEGIAGEVLRGAFVKFVQLASTAVRLEVMRYGLWALGGGVIVYLAGRLLKRRMVRQ